jgi:hypothetical protein
MFDVPLIGFLQERLKIGKLQALYDEVVFKTGLLIQIIRH